MEALMSANSGLHSPWVVLNAPKQNKPLITFARAIYGALLNNSSFPSPNPPLDAFAKDIDEFDDAETKAASRAKGAAAQRDACRRKVKGDLAHLRDYVQGVVETSPGDGAALSASAFMRVKKPTVRATPELRAANTDFSGRVRLAAKAVAPMATYYWEYSLDQTTWTAVPETMQTRTEITGLTSARTYYFRFRALTRAGRGDYSQVVSLLVH
jgi:hypothetical protein